MALVYIEICSLAGWVLAYIHLMYEEAEAHRMTCSGHLILSVRRS